MGNYISSVFWFDGSVYSSSKHECGLAGHAERVGLDWESKRNCIVEFLLGLCSRVQCARMIESLTIDCNLLPFSQIPASRLAQIYGAKTLFGLSVLFPSILTLFVPMAGRHSFSAVVILRTILGLVESASFPSMYHLFPRWIPKQEKTIMITSAVSGMYLGEILGFSLSGILIESTDWCRGNMFCGWDSVFYFFGALGVAWFPLWHFFAYEDPESHPFVTIEERQYLAEGTACAVAGL